jgi:hypothetical protein
MSTNFDGFPERKGFFRAPDDKSEGGGGAKDEEPSNVLAQLKNNLQEIKKLVEEDLEFKEAIKLVKASRELSSAYQPVSKEEQAAINLYISKIGELVRGSDYEWGKKDELIEEQAPSSLSKMSTQKKEIEQFSQLEELRKRSLIDLFIEWQTESIVKGDEIRFVLFKVIKEKVALMKNDFINLALEKGEDVEIGEQRFIDFSNLIEPTFYLIDYGVLSIRSLNNNNLTAKHESLIQTLALDGAMVFNIKFNKNPLINSKELDRKKFSSDMGIIQKMVFAAYQEMKKSPKGDREKTPTNSDFSRNMGFTAETSKKFFEEYLPSINEIEVVDEENVDRVTPFSLGIKDELEKFPEEAKQLICFIAKLKTTRDDLGSKAGLWHLGRHKGAFKFSDGEKGRPTGLLSAILYNVGKNSAREMHAATLAWIDLRNIETLVQGSTDRALSDNLSRKNPLYKKWDVSAGGDALQNQKVILMMEEIHNYMLWRNPNWEKLNFKKYEPEHWDSDFPAVDDMTNQTEKALLPDDYQKSKNAFLKIIETANSVFASLTLSGDPTQMREKIQVLVKNISSEIAKAGSYIGQYKSDNKYFYAHQLLDAAVRFYFWGILNAVPGRETYLGQKVGSLPGRSLDYAQLYDVAIKTMINQVTINTSLATGYKDSFIKFLENPYIKRPWIYSEREMVGFNAWRIKNNPDLEDLGYLKRQQELDKPPECPVNVSSGWKSSYLDPDIQKSI